MLKIILSYTRSHHPSSPRSGHGHPGAAPSRKYAVPEAGAFWRNREAFCNPESIQASQVSGLHERTRRSSSSNSLSTCSSSSDFSRSFHGLDAQQLSDLMTGDTESGSKLGLLFTDAAHSVLDSAWRGLSSRLYAKLTGTASMYSTPAHSRHSDVHEKIEKSLSKALNIWQTFNTKE